jgi:hypothetical protein
VSAPFAVGVAALILPVLGVRRRIRAEKRTELKALRARINADREAILAVVPAWSPGANSCALMHAASRYSQLVGECG